MNPMKQAPSTFVEQRDSTSAQPSTALQMIRQLARDKFAARADEYDRNPRFPTENFIDLLAAGLIAPTLGTEWGGLGLGHHRGDIHTLWEMTSAIAAADLSMARCWEAHANSVLLLDCLGTAAQKARWAPGIVEKGEIWAAWSGEPLLPKPGEVRKFGTTLVETPEGFIIHGTKVFCSGAPGADKAILLVHRAGRGGARHSSGAPEGLLLLVADLHNPDIEVDGSWWDPIGMRSSVSYLVKFNNAFIPKENLLGKPGEYLLDEWQTRFSPHYGATFLGGATSAYDYALTYARSQGKEADPYVQHRIGKMSVALETGHLWMQQTARLWETGRNSEARAAGARTRYMLEQVATEVMEHCLHICGARGLIRPSRLERIYRDLSFYMRHDSLDHVLATVGKAALGMQADASFFRPNPAPLGKEGKDEAIGPRPQ
jgi:alkylation response protein AidB-like acyl-CoA dehydrogenase